jgi:hypothetical protein
MEVSVTARVMDAKGTRRKAREDGGGDCGGELCLCDDDFDARASHPSGISPAPRNLEKTTPTRDNSTTAATPCCSHVCPSDRQSLRRGHACDAFRRARRSRVRLECLRTTSESPTETLLDDALLSILGSSSAARSPPATQRPGGTLANRLAREAGLDRPTQSREMIESERRSQYQRQIYRNWRPGDVYSPSDLTGAEQKKWKTGTKKPQSDAFDVLGINPVLEYKVCCRQASCAPTGS